MPYWHASKGPDPAPPVFGPFAFHNNEKREPEQMSTAAQAAASKQNSQQSTGPRTEAGKAVSRLNALRHGATSKTPVLPGEDPKEFERFEKALLADLHPTTEAETIQAHRVAALSWRLNRMYDMEANVLAACMDHVGAESFLDAAALYTEPENEKRLRLFNRYLTSAERAYNKALADFRALQKENRRRFEEENGIEAAWCTELREEMKNSEAELNALAKQPIIPPAASLRFVSQNSDAIKPATTTAPISSRAPHSDHCG